MPSCNTLLAAFAVLLLISPSNSQLERSPEFWKKRLEDVVNIHMVKDVMAIRNLDAVITRRVYPKDCDEVFQLSPTYHHDGLYVIQPQGTHKLVAMCRMDGCNGWTVIQKNSHNSELTWSETWTTYKYGFGDLENDHWLGNKFINLISAQKWYKVRIELVDGQNNGKYAEYDSFVMKGEEDAYQLRLGMYEGTAGDSLSSSRTKNMHDNMKFSAKDQDNDRSTLENCASVNGGAWWYDSCFDAQLNRKIDLHWKTACDGDCKNSTILLKPIHMYCHRV
uniref:Fibrinogen C-terminal domain-containing protein n=1 Tax=Pelusios castaneus TaxID=367368 RepID=A0A8C8SM44_9SAUR